MTSPIRTLLAALALAVALAPTADAATKHRKHKTKRPAAAKVVKKATPVATPAPAPVATPAAAPAVTSVIAIGGYVFYNLTYAQAVEAYTAAVAAAPAGYTPPPVTSVSVDMTVGGTVG